MFSCTCLWAYDGACLVSCAKPLPNGSVNSELNVAVVDGVAQNFPSLFPHILWGGGSA